MLLHPVLLPLAEVTGALAVVVVAQGCPIDHSILLLCPLVVLALAVAKTRTGKTQTERAQAAAPLGQVEAIVGTVFLSPCNMREGLLKDASRLLCRRLLRPRGSVVADCCSAKSCS